MTSTIQDQKVAQFFDSVAEIYADNYVNGSFLSHLFSRRLKIVFDLLEPFDKATILDVGCGPGMMAQYAIDKGFDFFGIDISEKMIDVCINKFGQTDSSNFSVGKIQDLKFPDSFFDVVLCMGALEYIDRNEIDIAISELSRVLKPNGLIIVSLMHKKSFLVASRTIKNTIKQKITRRIYDVESHDTFSKSFDVKFFKDLLSSHQLSTDVEAVFWGLHIFPSFLEERLPNKLKIFLSKGLDHVIRGRFKWPYMAFVVTAKKRNELLIRDSTSATNSTNSSLMPKI